MLSVAAITGAVLMGFGLYRLISGRTKGTTDPSKLEGNELLMFHLLEDIKKIGTVQLNDEFVIPFDRFVDIYKVIRHHAKAKISLVSLEFKLKRRSQLSPDNTELNPEYKDTVIRQTRMEEEVY